MPRRKPNYPLRRRLYKKLQRLVKTLAGSTSAEAAKTADALYLEVMGSR